jgi:hypothetical protein
MSIACPYCKTVLTPKGLKPGKYTPKCPRCGNPFLLFVPKEEGGAVSVQRLSPQKPAGGEEDTVRMGSPQDTVRVPAVKPKSPPPAEKPLPDTVRVPAVKPKDTPIAKPAKPVSPPTTDPLPVQSARPPLKTAPPGANTDVISKGSASAKPPAPRSPQPPPGAPADVEDAAAALLDGRDPDEASEPGPEDDAPGPRTPDADPNSGGGPPA